ncbi:patatin-like phospholipase family protein [Anatilimnocola floriformis]|uniref:patatin-like phospholipase family protein n=1 Tax=Anatilimnocola floriformis TaxID=2948575 RepID=UPI0020C52FA2|nr:patatin-like phospholipase family protein [Anatilimnocola floriformis]
MTDELTDAYRLRRPLLLAAAAEIQQELAEFLADQKLACRASATVATAEEFTAALARRKDLLSHPLTDADDQIVGRIDVYDFQNVAVAEDLVGKLYTVHSADWLDAQAGKAPVRRLSCVVPLQAMPDGWSSRRDVPVYFRLDIEATQQPPPALRPLPRVVYPPDPHAPLALIMKGGGIKGLAYVGALEELTKRYRFNWFVGTSAGAITAILLGAGYTPEEMKKLMSEKDFRDFFDASWYMYPSNLIFHQGLHHANAFTIWLDELLANKLNSQQRVRLKDLPHRVTVYASRRGRRTLKFDSIDADADAAYAARCSMSIPYVFVPQKEQGIHTYDGGIHQNFPVEELLRDHPGTEFVSLFLGPEIYETPKSRFVISDLLSIWTEGADIETVSRYRDQTVVIDPRPVGTLDFDLSADEKEYLLACGRTGALAHLASEAECTAARTARDTLKATILPIRTKRWRWKWARRTLYCALAGLAYVAYRIFF